MNELFRVSAGEEPSPCLKRRMGCHPEKAVLPDACHLCSGSSGMGMEAEQRSPRAQHTLLAAMTMQECDSAWRATSLRGSASHCACTSASIFWMSTPGRASSTTWRT